MHCGILQFCRDFRKIQFVFPNHLLAFLQFDPPDIFRRGNVQMLVEQCCQITGTHIHLPRHKWNRKILPDVGADIHLHLADDAVLALLPVIHRLHRFHLPHQQHDQLIQQRQNHFIGKNTLPLLLLQQLRKQRFHRSRDCEFTVLQAL